MRNPDEIERAFPHVAQDDWKQIAYGMSLRDYFAANVMGSMLIDAESYTQAAQLAYEYADAMLAERAK